MYSYRSPMCPIIYEIYMKYTRIGDVHFIRKKGQVAVATSKVRQST